MKTPFLRKYLDRLYYWSAWMAAVSIAAICLLVVCQVGLNLLDRLATMLTGEAIGLTIPSYADFTGFFLAAASFLALAHTLRQGGHIRVSLILTHLGPRSRFFAEIWCILLAATVSIYFSCYTFLLIRESYIYNDLSSGMVAVPLWIPQSAMLLGLIVLSIALVDELFCTLSGKTPSYVGAGEKLLHAKKSTPVTGESGEKSCH